PVAVRTLWNKKRHGVDWLKGRSVYAFCAIGNPDAFRRTLEEAGAKIEKFLPFEDHHRYTAIEGRRINAEAQEFMAETLGTTEKAATRPAAEALERPTSGLRVGMEVAGGGERLETALRALVRDLAPVAAASR